MKGDGSMGSVAITFQNIMNETNIEVVISKQYTPPLVSHPSDVIGQVTGRGRGLEAVNHERCQSIEASSPI